MRAQLKQFALKPVSHALFEFKFEALSVFTLVISSTRTEFGRKSKTSFSSNPVIIIFFFCFSDVGNILLPTGISTLTGHFGHHMNDN